MKTFEDFIPIEPDYFDHQQWSIDNNDPDYKSKVQKFCKICKLDKFKSDIDKFYIWYAFHWRAFQNGREISDKYKNFDSELSMLKSLLRGVKHGLLYHFKNSFKMFNPSIKTIKLQINEFDPETFTITDPSIIKQITDLLSGEFLTVTEHEKQWNELNKDKPPAPERKPRPQRDTPTAGFRPPGSRCRQPGERFCRRNGRSSE